jgi:hypothetical protein
LSVAAYFKFYKEEFKKNKEFLMNYKTVHVYGFAVSFLFSCAIIEAMDVFKDITSVNGSDATLEEQQQVLDSKVNYFRGQIFTDLQKNQLDLHLTTYKDTNTNHIQFMHKQLILYMPNGISVRDVAAINAPFILNIKYNNIEKIVEVYEINNEVLNSGYLAQPLLILQELVATKQEEQKQQQDLMSQKVQLQKEQESKQVMLKKLVYIGFVGLVIIACVYCTTKMCMIYV